MIRLSYVSPRLGERVVDFEKAVIRFGRDEKCDISFESSADPRVAPFHGRLVLEDGKYVLIERPGCQGVWINGKRVGRVPLVGGEHVRLGWPEGPEIRVLFVAGSPFPAPMTEENEVTEIEPEPLEALKALGSEGDPPVTAPAFQVGGEELQAALAKAQDELVQMRRDTDSHSSGHTMVVMARALLGVHETAAGRTARWKRGLWGVLAASALIVLALGGVVWIQHQRIAKLVNEKVALDGEIQSIFAQMAVETDEEKLEQLEARLELLMGKAAQTFLQVRRASAEKALEAREPPDELEVEIRKILASFHAETYAIPPIFEQALRQQMNELLASPGLALAFWRKDQYWPVIEAALREKQLPVELGYIAYTESHFDPAAVNAKSGATGMWQLMDETARQCGMVVRRGRDDRLDPVRSSNTAACYLSKLLVEFGEEAFMLVLASYNRGENGVRQALHVLAREPGGYRKRDFWHLYRLKLLPEETRDYVPKVIAAAIILSNPDKYRPAPRPHPR
jgi:soluble lytic murein transglycosylase-like protein